MSATGLPVADRATTRRAGRDLVRGERRAVVVVLVLQAAAAAAGLAAPRLLGEIVDEVLSGVTVARVDKLALAIAVCTLVQGVLLRYGYLAGYRLGERAIARLREWFVRRTLDLPAAVVERAGTGDLANRSSVDVATVGTMVRDVVPILLIAAAQLVLLFGAVFLIHPVLGLVALAGLPSILAVTRWYLRRASPAYLAEGAASADLTEALTTTAEGARTVESLRLREERVRSGTDRIARQWAARRRTLHLRSVFYPVVEGSYGVPVAVVLLAGGALARGGAISIGDVVAAALLLQQAIDPLDRVLQFIEQAQRGVASYARVLGVGTGVPEQRGVAPTPGDERLVVRGARFAYTPGHDVLHGIDLELRTGERLAIVGPSGAGKSTLARLLAGTEAPDSGAVTLGGVPVADIDPARRRQLIALVTQEHHVFIGTLRDNLSFAAPDATDADMLSALADAFIFNSMQFWTGNNPIKLTRGPDGHIQEVQLGDQTISVFWAKDRRSAELTYRRQGQTIKTARISEDGNSYRLMEGNGQLRYLTEQASDGGVNIVDGECNLVDHIPFERLRQASTELARTSS